VKLCPPKARATFYTEYAGLELLSPAWTWDAELFTLDDSARPIAAFELSVVPWCRKSRRPLRWWPRPAEVKPYRPFDKQAPKAPVGDGTEPPPDHGTGGDVFGPDVDIIDDPRVGPDDEWWPEFDLLLAEIEERRKAGAGGGGGGSGGGGGGPPPPPPDLPDPPVAPDPAPPPPEPVAPRPPRRDGRGKSRYKPIPVVGETGEVIGHILDNEGQHSFDVHCAKHTDCSIGRTYLPWEPREGHHWTEMRQSQGRPLAFLISWLRWGQQFPATDAGRTLHMDARHGRGRDGCIHVGTGALRLGCRAYVEAEPSPEFAALRARERQPRVGEALEPLGKV